MRVLGVQHRQQSGKTRVGGKSKWILCSTFQVSVQTAVHIQTQRHLSSTQKILLPITHTHAQHPRKLKERSAPPLGRETMCSGSECRVCGQDQARTPKVWSGMASSLEREGNKRPVYALNYGQINRKWWDVILVTHNLHSLCTVNPSELGMSLNDSMRPTAKTVAWEGLQKGQGSLLGMEDMIWKRRTSHLVCLRSCRQETCVARRTRASLI